MELHACHAPASSRQVIFGLFNCCADQGHWRACRAGDSPTSRMSGRSGRDRETGTARDSRPCTSPPSPAGWAAPASSAACVTTSTPPPACRTRRSRSSPTPVTTSPCSACGSVRTSTPCSTPSAAASTRAGLGARRREPPRAGGARRVRRRAAVVRARRPRHRHARRAVAVAGSGCLAQRGDAPAGRHGGACPSGASSSCR